MKGRLLGSYRLLKELGSGGTATVYLARVEGTAPDLTPGERVAVKVIHPHLIGTRNFLKRLQREVALGQRVQHPNIVRTLGMHVEEREQGPVHFVTMEFVEGQTLREFLSELPSCAEGLCRHISREVARALVAIHRTGIIHRDIKPENILITRDENVKVMDLGVARLREEALRISQPGQFVGSILYAAPEQFFEGGKDLDGRADLFSLGVTLYELSTGEHPFGGSDIPGSIHRLLRTEPRPPSRINPQISAFLEVLILCLLSKDRAGRIASAENLVEILEGGEETAWWAHQSGKIRVETKRPPRRVQIPRETGLYGRDAELEQLRADWESAKAGDGQVVILEGEAGIGKSRLLDILATELEEGGEDLLCCFGAYAPGGAATASGAFSTAFREALGPEDLARRLHISLGLTRSMSSVIAAVLTGEPAPEGLGNLAREAIEAGFHQLARALARERPLLVLIDDLHNAPEEGRALFASLAHAIQGEKILLIGTARPELPVEWEAALERIPSFSLIRIGRLSPRDVGRILFDALRSAELAEELWPLIATKSDGNPFFIFEILRTLKERKKLARRKDGRWMRSAAIRDVGIPDSILALVRARIESLDDEDRELLEMAACSSFEFDPVVVADAMGHGRIPTLKRLASLQREHRIVHAAGRRFAFDHHQIQEALYEGLSEPLREEYHRAFGETLIRRESSRGGESPDLPGPVAVEVCSHMLKAGRGDLVLSHLDTALTHLEAGFLHAPAVELADRALEVKDLVEGRRRIELLLRKSARLGMLGKWVEQREAWEEGLRLAQASGEPDLEIQAILHLSSPVDLGVSGERAKSLYRRALKLARRTGDPGAEGWAIGALGLIHEREGRVDAAVRKFARHRTLATEVGDRLQVAKAEGNLALVLWQMGRFDESLQHGKECLALFREIGDRWGESKICGNLGSWYYEFGRYDEARDLYQRQLELAGEVGYRKGEMIASSNLGIVQSATGHYADAIRCFTRDIALCEEMGHENAGAVSKSHLATIRSACGDYENAHQLWDEATKAFRASGECRWVAYGHLYKGCLFEEEERTEEAETAYREAIGMFREHGFRGSLPTALTWLGRFELGRGNTEAGRRHLEEAVALGEELGNLAGTTLAAAYLAGLPGGDPAQASALLEEREDQIEYRERMEARFQLFRETGEPRQLEAAHSLLLALLDRAPAEVRESMSERVPLHREILAAWEEQGPPCAGLEDLPLTPK